MAYQPGNNRTMVRREAMLKRMGQEIRDIREGLAMPQQEISDTFGWGRDAVSKLERGLLNISLYDYLRLMDSLRAFEPDHPAIALYDHLKPRIRHSSASAASPPS